MPGFAVGITAFSRFTFVTVLAFAIVPANESTSWCLSWMRTNTTMAGTCVFLTFLLIYLASLSRTRRCLQARPPVTTSAYSPRLPRSILYMGCRFRCFLTTSPPFPADLLVVLQVHGLSTSGQVGYSVRLLQHFYDLHCYYSGHGRCSSEKLLAWATPRRRGAFLDAY